MQQFLGHGAVARLLATALTGCTPYSLAGLRFHDSPMARRNLCGVPQDGRATSAMQPARHPARCLASQLRNVRATGRQPPTHCRRMTGETTRKITGVTPMSGARRPPGNLRDNPRSVRATAVQQPCNSPRKIPQATREIPTADFQPSQLNIMNTPTIPQPTLDLESLRKAIQEFRPNPHRVPFNSLKPFHDSIVELRAKRASYRSVAELLQQHGVKTSRARVAEYGRIVLDGGKSRKRRKQAKTLPDANTVVAPQSVPALLSKPGPASTAPADELPPQPTENDSYKSRGPRIARIRMADGSILGEKSPGQTP